MSPENMVVVVGLARDNCFAHGEILISSFSQRIEIAEYTRDRGGWTDPGGLGLRDPCF